MKTLNIGGSPVVGNPDAQPEREGANERQGASQNIMCMYMMYFEMVMRSELHR